MYCFTNYMYLLTILKRSNSRHIWDSCYSILTFMCMFCRSLLSFFFWPLCCLYFFNLRILITPLLSSNTSSYYIFSPFFKCTTMTRIIFNRTRVEYYWYVTWYTMYLVSHLFDLIFNKQTNKRVLNRTLSMTVFTI